MNIKLAKNVIYAIWLAAIVYLFLVFIIHPDFFSPQHISSFIKNYSQSLWLSFVFCSFIRGFFLMPSTPFVLTGIVLFPHYKIWVFIISLLGVVFSSTMLYHYSDILGFSKYLEKKFPKQIPKIQKLLTHKWSFIFIFIWSIIPVVPTDTVAYVAGIIKMKYSKLIVGIFLGELTLISIYVFFGNSIMENLGKFFEYYKF